MFNSAILDVIIGLAFIYTLLSLICSSLTEWFARFLSLRSKTLLKGIESLLGDEYAERLYNHSLIKGLTTQKGKPSYIPAHTFFLAVMDIITEPKQQAPSQNRPIQAKKIELVRQVVSSLPSDSEIKGMLLERIDTIANFSSTPEEKEMLLNQIEGVAKIRSDVLMKKNLLDDIDAQIARTKELMASEDHSVPPTETTENLEKIHELKAAVAKLPEDSGIRNMFLALINNPEIVLMDTEMKQLQKVQEHVEKWFDDAMDRVSGWYKRNTQIVIFLWAIIVTVTMNVDTLTIINQLHDESTRNAVVSAAVESLDNAELASLASGEEQAQKSLGEKLTDNIEEFQRQPLPIGWSQKDADKNVLDTFKEEWPARLPGWLLTVIAVSLGAPFWFQLLNKIVSLRSSGNRPPKASGEKSE